MLLWEGGLWIPSPQMHSSQRLPLLLMRSRVIQSTLPGKTSSTPSPSSMACPILAPITSVPMSVSHLNSGPTCMHYYFTKPDVSLPYSPHGRAGWEAGWEMLLHLSAFNSQYAYMAYVYTETRDPCQVFSSIASLSHFGWQSFLLNLELIDAATLAGQQSLSTAPALALQVAGDQSKGLICVRTSPLSSEPQFLEAFF